MNSRDKEVYLGKEEKDVKLTKHDYFYFAFLIVALYIIYTTVRT